MYRSFWSNSTENETVRILIYVNWICKRKTIKDSNTSVLKSEHYLFYSIVCQEYDRLSAVRLHCSTLYILKVVRLWLSWDDVARMLSSLISIIFQVKIQGEGEEFVPNKERQIPSNMKLLWLLNISVSETNFQKILFIQLFPIKKIVFVFVHLLKKYAMCNACE